ncbi:MAG: rod shape-determining protein MreC [Chitinophagaceae bacterium]|nr:rod shape-determining protein MreC [Chitinophagaceae bacterium]
MRNIIVFIRVYFTFFIFVFLLILSLMMLFKYNKYHNAVYSEAASEITGVISKKYNDVAYYFDLKRVNDSLVRANEELYNKLRADYELPDTVINSYIDGLVLDSVPNARKYLYRNAKVIRNSVSQPNNYIILHRGRKQGVNNEMGVISPNGGVVGTVVEVSNNYAMVMSLLHSQSNVSARLKNGGETGTIKWDGKERDVLLLKDISKAARISQGDTVITSGFSYKFPEGLIIGRVINIINDKSSSTYTVRVRPSFDFENLQYAYVIENLQAAEPNELLEKAKNK